MLETKRECTGAKALGVHMCAYRRHVQVCATHACEALAEVRLRPNEVGRLEVVGAVRLVARVGGDGGINVRLQGFRAGKCVQDQGGEMVRGRS